MIVGVISSVVLILIGEPFPASLGGLLLSAIPLPSVGAAAKSGLNQAAVS